MRGTKYEREERNRDERGKLCWMQEMTGDIRGKGRWCWPTSVGKQCSDRFPFIPTLSLSVVVFQPGDQQGKQANLPHTASVYCVEDDSEWSSVVKVTVAMCKCNLFRCTASVTWPPHSLVHCTVSLTERLLPHPFSTVFPTSFPVTKSPPSETVPTYSQSNPASIPSVSPHKFQPSSLLPIYFRFLSLPSSPASILQNAETCSLPT